MKFVTADYIDKIAKLIEDLGATAEKLRELSDDPVLEVWGAELAGAHYNIRHGAITLGEIRRELRQIEFARDLGGPSFAMTEKGRERLEEDGKL